MTIILSGVLYGCETWSLTLREKSWHANGEWRRLHNEELCSLYCSVRVIKSRRLRLAGQVILTGAPKGKRALGRPRRVDGRTILEWILKK